MKPLPVLSSVVVELLALDSEDEHFPDRVADLIGGDASFAARVLTAANSAASAPASPVTTVPAALTRIGGTGAVDLVLSAGLGRAFVPRDDADTNLCRHSIEVAAAARCLAQHCRALAGNGNEAYAAGLLHDVGYFVMSRQARAELRQVEQATLETGDTLVAVEKAICGTTHAELGDAACHQWGIPRVISEVVRDHHNALPGQLSQPSEWLTAIVALADVATLPCADPLGRSQGPAATGTSRDALILRLCAAVNISPVQLFPLLETAAAQAETTWQLLGVG